MKGLISLCIDRQPDFFSLLRYRGQHEVIVILEGSLVVGSFSASQQKVFISGNPETIFYLADFKVHPAYRGSSVAVRLVRAMLNYLQTQSADLLFCTAAEGNNRVFPFFQGRLGIPAWADIGKFTVFQILPSGAKPDKSLDIRQVVPEGFSLFDFYQAYFLENYTVAPLIEANDLEKMANLMVVHEGMVVAAISLIDTYPIKQNVVIDMPFWLKGVVSLSKGMHGVFGWVSLPGVGESIRMLNIRYWAFDQGYDWAFKALVQHARRIAAAEKHHFLSIGVQEQDPVRAVLGSIRHIPFTSNGFVTSLKNMQEKIQNMREGLVFEDFSLV
ncbi:MAG: GNAT family N-acetyltransferase [Saprospiraceae bacterium]